MQRYSSHRVEIARTVIMLALSLTIGVREAIRGAADPDASNSARKCYADDQIFRYETASEMLKVHLYFVKLFGCHIAGNGIPLDITGFADAIMNEKAHSCVYLKFGSGRMFAGMPMTGMSECRLRPHLLADKHIRYMVL